MSDVPAGTGMETGTAVESSVLLQRLERRRTEPPGVIDVHWPQAHYARTAGWIAQRFPLLQQLAVRYGGGDDGQTGSGLMYRTAEAFPSKLLSASTLETAFPPAAGVSSTVSTVPPATPATLRVSRRPPSLAAKPAPAAVPILSSTPEEGRLGGEAPQSREAVTSMPPPSLQTPNRVIARQVTGTPVQGIPKVEAGISPVQGDSLPSGKAAVLPPAGAGDTTPVGNSPMVPADWQRSLGEPPTLTTAKPELKRVKPVPLAASQPATQLLLKASSAVPARVAPAQPPASSGREVPTLQPAAALQPRITPTLTLPPQGGGNEPVRLQRQPDDTQASALPATAAAGVVNSHTSPVVMEIRDSSTFGQKSGMIWRKSSNALVTGEAGGAGMGGSARATLPLTLKSAGNSALPVARQAITTATIPASSPANTQSLLPLSQASEPSPAGMDWEQLIEQVGRHILRQLTIARERRGLKGWN